MLIDVGLGSIRFFGMLIAIFLGTRLIPDEIEKRTIYIVLAKPVRRWRHGRRESCRRRRRAG